MLTDRVQLFVEACRRMSAGDRSADGRGDGVRDAEAFLERVAAEAGGFELLLGVVADMKDPECCMFIALELLTKEYLISTRRGTNISRIGMMIRKISKY